MEVFGNVEKSGSDVLNFFFVQTAVENRTILLISLFAITTSVSHKTSFHSKQYDKNPEVGFSVL